jgi:cobalt/nickel transport system ATP-binding protein
MADRALITIEGLAFAYDGMARTLEAVDLSVAAGERVGIVGPNGAGKSTLFLCLTGVLQGYGGRIAIDGLSPGTAGQLPALRRKVGMVFQSSDDQLFNPTVLEDVAFGPINLGMPREAALAAAREALARVGIEPGLHGRPPHQISNGQKRRVALAGILAMSPIVLLLDEPTSDLDPRGRAELIELLRGLGGTHLIAGHDLEMIRQTCGRVVLLDAGQIVADGPTDTIFADEALMHGHGLFVPHSLQCCHDHGDGAAHRHAAADHSNA